MIALVRMLHVLALDVLVFNLVILNCVLHELIQLVERLTLLVVRLSSLLHLVVVDNMWVHTRVILLSHLEGVLRFLLLLLATARGEFVL